MSFEILLDTPGMGDIASDQRESTMGGCTVFYSWSAPNNTDLRDISHFMVYFNGSRNSFGTTGNSVFMKAQSVCTCASHNITIFAVDRCNRSGQPQFHVVSDVPNFDGTCKDLTMDRTNQPATDTARCQNDGMIILSLRIQDWINYYYPLFRFSNSFVFHECGICSVCDCNIDCHNFNVLWNHLSLFKRR